MASSLTEARAHNAVGARVVASYTTCFTLCRRQRLPAVPSRHRTGARGAPDPGRSSPVCGFRQPHLEFPAAVRPSIVMQYAGSRAMTLVLWLLALGFVLATRFERRADG
jgi:hypothetical protein